ncbi:MAG: hypothetical protein QOG62_476 [Thermoleophilaceae bacterium]|jgi:uncharacterized protein YbcI|nr:hypothetical protein [Thermoleophilaceae bacterium]
MSAGTDGHEGRTHEERDGKGELKDENLDPQELIDAAADAVAQDPARSVKAEVAKAMVGLHKRFYGKGPERARAFIHDEYVFVVMEGGLTQSEETLIAAGKEELVRSYRLEFQATMAPTALEALSEIVGRRVLDYHSQIVFHPPRIFEILVLEPADPAD